MASNHGEEVSDDNENELKVVQCIGGGATNGQTDEGIIIISGKSCTIAKFLGIRAIAKTNRPKILAKGLVVSILVNFWKIFIENLQAILI